MKKFSLLFLGMFLGAVLGTEPAHAGGGPMNVLVLYNADEPDAEAVAQYYGQARSLPAAHLCGIGGVDSTTRTLDFAEYQSLIHTALTACLQTLPHPEEIDYLVVVRGLPYRVNLPDGAFFTSLSAMLQVYDAERTSDGSLLAGQPQHYDQYYQASINNPSYVGGFCQAGDLLVTNQYSGWYETACSIVRETDHPPSHQSAAAGAASGYEFAGNLFVVTRLDGFDYVDAQDLVDRALAADGSYPTADLLCMEGGDAARGARDPECEFTARHLALAGFSGTWLTPFDSALTGHTVSAYFTGTAGLRDGIAGNTYEAGAITCNLTSTGAAPSNFFCNADGTVCPQSESQTSIARFVRAGATGAHGAVAEPLNNTFPGAGTLLHYTFGYNLGESYFFNQRFLYWQNIYLGDPLTTPFAERPEVTISPVGEAPRGGAITVQATHPQGVAAIRVYVDGERVAEGAGATLDWIVDRDVGSSLSVLAVAVAENAEVQRSGWPVETHLPRPDVQGWQTASLTVGEEVIAPDGGVAVDGAVDLDGGVSTDASGPDEGDNKSGCGCGSAPPNHVGYPLGLMLMLMLLWLGVRLRRLRYFTQVKSGTGRPRRR
jgi:uncharacterized protein (TIGR03790 family)